MPPTDAPPSSREPAAVAAGGPDAALASMLFETAAAGVAIIDRELRYVRINDALAAMNGLPAGEHVGRSVREVLPSVAADALEPLVRRVMETGEPVLDLAFVADVPGRGPRDFLASYVPVRGADGTVTGAAALVAERTPAEAALRETEGRLRHVAESGIVGLFFWSMDGGITEANDAFLAMLGYTQRDLAEGRVDWRRMTPTEYAAADEAAVRELLATGRHGQVAKEYVGKDGRRVPVVVTSALLDRSTDRGVCVCLDDTARRAAEARLGRVLMQTPAAVAVLLGPDHVVQSVNEMFMRLFGRRDYVGRPARETTPELVEQGFIARLDEVYRTGVSHVGREAPLVWDRDGDGTAHEGYFDYVHQPLVDASGAVEGILVFAVEVTAQVLARRATEDAARRTALLQALTAALAGTQTMEDVASVVVAQAVAATGAKTGMLAAPVPGTEDAVIVRQAGFTEDVLTRHRRFPLAGSSPAARCLRTGEAIWVTGLGEDTLMARFPDSESVWRSFDVSALATVPLLVGSDVVGTMSFTWAEPRALSPGDREFFLALGAQAAQALERARLLASERAARERTEQLQALTAALSEALETSEVIRIAVGQGVHALRADAWLMMLLDASGEHLEAVADHGYPGGLPDMLRRMPASGDAPVAEVARTGRTLTYRTREERARRFPLVASLLAEYEVSVVLPLTVRGRTLGALGIHRREGGDLGEDALAFMEAFARQTAQALDRARAYEGERMARAEAEAAWRRAEHASREAEEANQAKSGFLATMSHELRTPLNAILGYAQLMDLGLAGPLTDSQRNYLDRLARSSNHLLGLVNDVLDLSKIEAGEIRVARADAMTGAAVRAALALVEPQAAAGGVRLVDARADEDGVAYVGDEDRVRQIVLNLLSNAVKFTERGGTITVGCDTTASAPPVAHLHGAGPWAFVRVTDTGVGIPPEEQGRIFEPFHQVESGHTRKAGGTGLGLAISRRLARLMGGDLTVESKVGVGSAFTLWLPAAQRAAGRQAETANARGARAEPDHVLLDAPGIGVIGEVLRIAADDIIASYVARLRVEPGIPGVSEMRRLEVEDHAVTLLADLSQSLVIVEGAGADATTLLRDSSAIQQAIAAAHGARRHAQGWSEAMVRRDHEILRAEVERALRRRLHGGGIDAALHVLTGLMTRAESVSVRAWRQAADSATPGA